MDLIENIDILEKADVKFLRDKLIKVVQERYFHQYMKDFAHPDYEFPSFPFKTSPNTVLKIFEWRLAYNKLIVFGDYVGLSYHLPDYYSFNAKTDLSEHQKKDYQDLGLCIRRFFYLDLDKAIYPVCLAAWLTIDDFRFDNLSPVWPKDLRYGLVTEYPRFVIPMAMFALGIDRYQLINHLRPGALQEASDYAYNSTRRHIPIT